MKELLAIQQELNAPKTLFNKFGGYHYRSAETILEALKPLLAKHECILAITDEVVEVGGRVYVKAIVTLSKPFGSEKEGAGAVQVCGWAREPENKKGADESQITGAASSYARKYALNGLFAIDDEKDADATNTHGKSDEGIIDRAVKAINNAKPGAELNKILDHCKEKNIIDDPTIQKAIKDK